MQSTLKMIAESWEGELVLRSEIAKFTSGALKPGTLANLDSRGCGPRGRTLLGKHIVYPKWELVRWLEERAACRGK